MPVSCAAESVPAAQSERHPSVVTCRYALFDFFSRAKSILNDFFENKIVFSTISESGLQTEATVRKSWENIEKTILFSKKHGNSSQIWTEYVFRNVLKSMNYQNCGQLPTVQIVHICVHICVHIQMCTDQNLYTSG